MLIELFDPRFGFDHRRVHALFDFEAIPFDRVAVGVGGDDDRPGDDARRGLKRPGDGESIPTLGAPGTLEGHSGADDRQAEFAGKINQARLHASSRPFGAVGGYAEMSLIDPSRHLAERPRAAARRRPAHDAESELLHDPRDQFAVAMIADQNVHFGPGPIIRWEKHYFMKERVYIASSQPARRGGIGGGIGVAEVEPRGTDKFTHGEGARGADGSLNCGMGDFHRVVLDDSARFGSIPPSKPAKSIPIELRSFRMSDYFGRNGRLDLYAIAAV